MCLNWSIFAEDALNVDQKAEILTNIFLNTSDQDVADKVVKDFLFNGLKTLFSIDHSPKSLVNLRKLFFNQYFWSQCLSQIKDPKLLSWWQNNWSKLPFESEVRLIKLTERIEKDFQEFNLTENFWEYSADRMSVAEIIEKDKFLCVNLGKGHLGEVLCKFFGTLILEEIKLAMAKRQNNNLFSLYVDEAQDFVQSEALADILSAGRRHGLSVALAHQYIKQIPEKVYQMIQANCASKVIFRCSNEDALSLQKETMPKYNAQDITSLETGEAIVRLWEKDGWQEAEKMKILFSDGCNK